MWATPKPSHDKRSHPHVLSWTIFLFERVRGSVRAIPSQEPATLPTHFCCFCNGGQSNLADPTEWPKWRLGQKNPRVRKIVCPQFWDRKWLRQFYGRLEFLHSFCRKTSMPIKYLLLGGRRHFGILGGADLTFMGAGILLILGQCSSWWSFGPRNHTWLLPLSPHNLLAPVHSPSPPPPRISMESPSTITITNHACRSTSG